MALFIEPGLDNTTMDAIAARAGVSRVTVYKHFSGKEALYIDVVREQCEQKLAMTRSLLASSDPFPRRLERYLLYSFEQYEQVLRGLMSNNNCAADLLQTFLHEEYAEQTRTIQRQCYAQGRREGWIDPALSDEVLDAYMEIVLAGLVERAESVSALLADRAQHRQLMEMIGRAVLRAP